MKANKVLITKSQGESEELSQAVRAAGFEPLYEPLLTIEYVEEGWPDLSGDIPLIFTSSHGVEACAEQTQVRGNPLYMVGQNTAETARALGFSDIRAIAPDVGGLMAMLSSMPEKELISAFYIRGKDVSTDLKQIIGQKGHFIEEFTAYRAHPAEKLSLSLLKSLDNREINAVMLFSGRGGKVFADLIEQYDRAVRLKTTKALCISEVVLKSVSVLPFQQGLIARTPDRYGMMELLTDISVI
jgi:uroporphyrinogen-III synthase